MTQETGSEKGKRIARNTLLLYCRMLFLMLVGLYTSRVVLDALGIEDYGIYNAVGGAVSIFAVISGALTGAISRFLTFELGRPDSSERRLRQIFRNSTKIQLMLAAIVIILAETLGMWFLRSHMSIPEGRLDAARWVLHFSVLTFAVNLVSIPYNAAIIAHEKMKAFALVGMFEGLGKLAVAFLLLVSPIDSLVWFASLMCAVALAVRLAYGIYCRRHFAECRPGTAPETEERGETSLGARALLKQMLGFAGWNFIGASSAVLRDHGGSLLINVFCGPAINAARGVTLQLSNTVQAFVTNFMTALNPQITKSYASDDREYLMKLVFKGARLSFFLLLMLGLPLMLNMDFVLGVWLKEVPPHAPAFAVLALCMAMSESLSNPLITLQLATGDIKKYQIIVGGLQLLNVPLSWVLLACGAAPECVVAVAIALSQVCLFARVLLLRKNAGLDASAFIREVYFKVLTVTVLALVLPLALSFVLPGGWLGFLASCAACVVSGGAFVWAVGLEEEERRMVLERVRFFGRGPLNDGKRVGIVTLPFHTNFGGILQAWALQTVVRRMGHRVEMVDTREQRPFSLAYMLGTAIVRRNTDRFIRHNIKCGPTPQEGRYDTLLVGSDQVWRPKYCKTTGMYFLDFARDWDVRRVGYSVSFGTADWEYDDALTANFAPLARLFDSVSVREDSAVELCREHFGIETVHTLDPTLLLTREDYVALIGRRRLRKPARRGIMCHIFDHTPEKLEFVKSLEKRLGMESFWTNNNDIDNRDKCIFRRAQYPLEEWLRGFRDADFVVADSFHACVFSIIFRKSFVVFGNAERGLSRFESLLGSLGMEGHLITRAEDFDLDAACTTVDPERLDALRRQSLDYLKNALK